MKQKTQSIFNIIFFQLGWWGCFFIAYESLSFFLLALLVLCFVTGHFLFVAHKKTRVREFLFFLLIALPGYACDSLFSSLKVVTFSESFYGLAPLWLLGMWFIFPMSIGYSFSWLKNRLWLAFIFGAIGGPLSYRFGESFGLIHFTGIRDLSIYACYWGFFMTFAVWLREKNFFRRENEA